MSFKFVRQERVFRGNRVFCEFSSIFRKSCSRKCARLGTSPEHPRLLDVKPEKGTEIAVVAIKPPGRGDGASDAFAFVEGVPTNQTLQYDGLEMEP